MMLCCRPIEYGKQTLLVTRVTVVLTGVHHCQCYNSEEQFGASTTAPSDNKIK